MVSNCAPNASRFRQILAFLLALRSNQQANALKADGGMTIMDMEMAEQGTFPYVSLPESVKEKLFKNFLLTYSREYDTIEEQDERFQNFKRSLADVDILNAAEKAHKGTAVFGISPFADLSHEEFRRGHLGTVLPDESERRLTEVADVPEYNGTSTSVDWTGILSTPVKDQGYCGSCWAFSATSQIESDAIKAGLTNPETILSVQQITKCTNVTDDGCQGGSPEDAYKYVTATGGITFEDFYPYNISARTCDSSRNDYTVTVVKYLRIRGEQKMINYVLAGGTLAAAVDASNLLPYKSGIYSSCGPNFKIDHSINIVGVNVTGGYWIIRNSWGADWGEKGYFKLALSVNMCGVAKHPTYVVVAATTPSTTPRYLPTKRPTSSPTSSSPTQTPTSEPTSTPTAKPTRNPTYAPTSRPTYAPTSKPTATPTSTPTSKPTSTPTAEPTRNPTYAPTSRPTSAPTSKPTAAPTSTPTDKPTNKPTATPTSRPTSTPTAEPTRNPTYAPTSRPTSAPTSKPTATPTDKPTATPTSRPTSTPTVEPTRNPTYAPTSRPTSAPTSRPTSAPTKIPTDKPTNKPTATPTNKPTATPTSRPTSTPTVEPTRNPTSAPTSRPTSAPTKIPTDKPTNKPTATPINKPTATPTDKPTNKPTATPTSRPTSTPTAKPTRNPTYAPTSRPTSAPTSKPTPTPTDKPTATPTDRPTAAPTNKPTPSPTK